MSSSSQFFPYEKTLYEEIDLEETKQKIPYLHNQLKTFHAHKSATKTATEIRTSDIQFKSRLQHKKSLGYEGIFSWNEKTNSQTNISSRKLSTYQQYRISNRDQYLKGISDVEDLAHILAKLAHLEENFKKIKLGKDAPLFIFCEVDGDIFKSVIKLRAAKFILSCFAKKHSMDLNHIYLVGRSSTRHWSPKDPWLNQLKLTAQGLSCYLGGVDFALLLPADEIFVAKDPALETLACDFHALLREEVGLNSGEQSKDLMKGSWFIEKETLNSVELVQKTYNKIMDCGGIKAYRKSALYKKRLTEQRQQVFHKDQSRMGVNCFTDQAPDEVVPFPLSPLLRKHLSHYRASFKNGEGRLT